MADLAELGFSVDSREVVVAEKRLDSLDKAGGRAEKRGDSLSKSFKRFLGGIGFVALARDTFNAASSLETMSASLRTVTGSAQAADKALEVVREFAKTTPFQLEQSVQGFIKLKSLGLDPSIAALRSYGNTASAMGKSLNQAIEAVADAATGEFERLKEFGIKAKSEGDRVTFTFQGVSTQVGKNASEIEGYLRSIGDVNFAGAMEEQSKTLGGVLSNLQDSFFNLQTSFFETSGLGDGLKNVMRDVSGAIQRLADSLSGETPRLVEDLGKAFSFLYEVFKGLVSAAAFAVTGISNLYDVLAPLYVQFANESVLFTPHRAFLALFESSSSVVGVMDVLKGIFTDTQIVGISLVEGLLVGVESIKGGFRIAGEAIKAAFIGSFDLILEGYALMLSKIAEGLDKIPGFGDQAASIRAFSSEVSKILTPLDNFAKNTAQINKETEQAQKEIRIITGEMVDEAIAAKSVSSELNSADKATASLNVSTGKLTKPLEKNAELLEISTDHLKEFKDEADRYARATGRDLIRTQDEINRALNESELYAKNYQSALEAAHNEVIKRAIPGTEAYAKAMNDLGFQIDEVADKSVTTQDIIREGWQDFQGSVEGAFKNAFDSGKGFFDSLKDTAFDILKQIAAKIAATFVIKQAVGALQGTQLGNFLGIQSGGDGSSLAGLLGSSQSQQAVGTVFGDAAGQSFTSVVGGASNAAGLVGNVQGVQAGLDQGGSSGLLSAGASAVGAYRNATQLVGLYNTLFGGAGVGAAAGVTAVTGVAGGVASANVIASTAIQAALAAQATTAAAAGAAAGVSAVGGTANAVAAANIVASQGVAAGTAGTSAAAGGSAVGGLAIAGGAVAVGLIVDKYLNDGRVQNGFNAELENTRGFIKDTFSGDLKDPIISLAEGIGISLNETFGGRSEQELGIDQFSAVVKSLEEGRSESVAVGSGVDFLGGFNDDGVFFGSSLSQEQLDQVGKLLEERGVADKSKGIGDGVLRVAAEGLNFSENNVEIVQQVKDAIAEVATTLTQAEQDIIGSMSNAFDQTGKSANSAFVQIDKAFDLIDDTTLSSADKLALAYSQAFDTTIEKGNEWVTSSELSADRFTQIFDAASGETLNSVLGFTDASATAIEGLGDSGQSAANNIEVAIGKSVKELIDEANNLDTSYQAAAQSITESFRKSADDVGGLYSGVDLGMPNPVVVRVEERRTVTSEQAATNSGLENQIQALIASNKRVEQESKMSRAKADVNS